MRINDLEYKTGLDRATIRYYEKEGMITPVRRDNGYRDYSNEDLQQLLKIKLLRQLGMPLHKIRALQQGSADFRTAMQEQITQLEVKRDTAQRSVQICRLMQSDGVTYESLNADYYLNQYNLSRAVYPQTAPNSKPPSTFHESVPREYHPFRHLFARLLDLDILLIFTLFVQVIFFRARSDVYFLPHILLLLLWIPLEALCYTLFATTPGKFAFGIRVDHTDGTKHSFASAIKRAFGAYRYGMGWGIPVWQLWRQYKCYKNYKEDEALEWNYDSEITYHGFWNWKNKCKPLIILTVFVAMTIATFLIADSPKYSGTELNTQQFVANYNDYWNRMGNDDSLGLNPDGTFMEKNPGQNVINVGSEMVFDNFQYTLENDVVTAVEYEEYHEKITLVSVMPERCMAAALALLGAQKGETINTLQAFRTDLNNKIESALNGGIKELELDYGNIHVYWKIEFENCKLTTEYGNMKLIFIGSETSTARIQFRVSLSDQDN